MREGVNKIFTNIFIGGDMGWIPNAAFVFRSKKQTGVYHDEMNSKHFEEWFKKTLIPNVPPNSVIVLDNAPYHNRVIDPVATKSSKKDVMRKWLTDHSIAWERSDLKSDLMNKIKESNPRKAYATDIIAETNGHVVLRTPVAHCELNPIELVWSKVKGYLRVNNTSFNLADLESLVPAAFHSVSQEMWRHFCTHAIKEEEKFWEKDCLLEDAIDEFLIELNVDDDEEDEISDDEEPDHEDRF